MGTHRLNYVAFTNEGAYVVSLDTNMAPEVAVDDLLPEATENIRCQIIDANRIIPEKLHVECNECFDCDEGEYRCVECWDYDDDCGCGCDEDDDETEDDDT